MFDLESLAMEYLWNEFIGEDIGVPYRAVSSPAPKVDKSPLVTPLTLT